MTGTHAEWNCMGLLVKDCVFAAERKEKCRMQRPVEGTVRPDRVRVVRARVAAGLYEVHPDALEIAVLRTVASIALEDHPSRSSCHQQQPCDRAQLLLAIAGLC